MKPIRACLCLWSQRPSLLWCSPEGLCNAPHDPVMCWKQFMMCLEDTWFVTMLPSCCSSSDERDSRTHLLSRKALLQIFCGACDGYNFLIEKLLTPSINLSGRGLSRNGPEDQQVMHKDGGGGGAEVRRARAARAPKASSSAASCITSSATSCAASFTGSSLTCPFFTCHLRAGDCKPTSLRLRSKMRSLQAKTAA